MANRIDGKRIAFIATDGVQHDELESPWQAVKEAGGTPELVSMKAGTIQAVRGGEKTATFQVDRTFDDASAADYDALVIPGGVANPDKLRTDARAVSFVRAFVDGGKPVAAICHGPWMLVEADALRGRTVTSWPSLRTDIRNAGGTWVDEEVHVDRGIVTSRKPDDLPAFNRTMLEEIVEGVHERTPAGTR